MSPPNIARKNRSPLDLLVHLAISLVVTYFLLLLIERSWPNSVAPYLSYHWLIWIAGLLILIALTIAGFNQKSVAAKSFTDQSKNTGNRLS